MRNTPQHEIAQAKRKHKTAYYLDCRYGELSNTICLYKESLRKGEVISKARENDIDTLLAHCEEVLSSGSPCLDNKATLGYPIRDGIRDKMVILADLTGRTTEAKWHLYNAKKRVQTLNRALHINWAYKNNPREI